MKETLYQVEITLDAEIAEAEVDKFFEWLIGRVEVYGGEIGGGWHIKEGVGYVFNLVLSGLSEQDINKLEYERAMVFAHEEWESDVIVTPFQDDEDVGGG